MSTRRFRQAALIAGLALFAAAPAAAEAKKIISISGSTSVFPLETLLAKDWIKTKKGRKFGFRILQGGSNVGVSDVSKGRVTMGASSREPAANDPGGLVFTKIARDAICMVTNNSNPLGNISTATVQGIFQGPAPTITNWTAVPGHVIGGVIDPVGRATTSGTHDAFKNIFDGGKDQAPSVAAKSSNGLVQQAVQSDPQAIGYVSLAFTSGVHVVPFNGINCDLRDAKSGAYGGVRNFYFVTQGNPVGGAKKFIKWVLHSKKANKDIGTDWVTLHG